MFDDYNHRAEQGGEEARVASAPTYTSWGGPKHPPTFSNVFSNY